MQTLQRTAAALIFPAIAWLGAACEPQAPTEAPPPPVMQMTGDPTLVVDDDGLASATDCNDLFTTAFMTISAAVAAANPGDVIKVCPGVYAEQVFIGFNANNVALNNLTLLGAKAGVDARTRAFVLTDESIIDHPCGPVQIAADNVTLDGFTVQGSSTFTDPPCGGGVFIGGIWTAESGTLLHSGHKIRNNIVQNNIEGIALNSTCTIPTVVQFNLIQNNNNPPPSPVLGNGTGIFSQDLCNTTIDGNKFSGHLNSSVSVFPRASSARNLDITNNELVGGTSEGIAFSFVSTGTISGNVSIGSTNSGTVRLLGGNENITINSNTLFNGMRGILVGNGPNSGVVAHFNCIQGNSVAGLEVSGTHFGILQAENDWWGSPNGPTNPNNPGGTGDKIIDPNGVVEFGPFLTQCPTGPQAPTQVNGGGQINVTGGRGSFGFSAKQRSEERRVGKECRSRWAPYH